APLLAAPPSSRRLAFPGLRDGGGRGEHPLRFSGVAASPAVSTAGDMQGGVFTLTSLGSYGIEFFTPVINHPEAAILGVGAIRMQPVPPPGGQEGFVLQRQLPLSLTFDHRIVDGGPAARFLGDLANRIAAADPGAAAG
ncbi:MAG: 2-oxo acid dehydrogenase subunit E2, partial [Planctomycetia bacterium]